MSFMTNVPFFLSISILIGLLAGYLVNYLADVLPASRSFSQPACRNCGTPFQWKDYLTFRTCSSCSTTRSLRSWLVQALFPIFFILLTVFPNPRLGFGYIVLITVYLGLVTVIDLEHRLVLTPTNMVGIFIGLIIGWHLHGFITTILGGAVGFVIMLALYFLGIAFAKFMGKLRGAEIEEVALGFGDVNLSGILGLMLGWPGITAGLFFAILMGGLVSLVYLCIARVTKRYQAFTAIPYAPFLVAGALILLLRP
jgi:leader peptidase (prepilin peptidase) / N-methyltransferase